LTSSTSEAYSYLFKLLTNPGDRILVPRPSYPLLEYLARMESIQTASYRLYYEDGWYFDLQELESNLTPEVKAVVLVNPNNPTGSYIHFEEWNEVKKLCIANQVALICDEVFVDYPLNERSVDVDLVEGNELLSFILNGLSKSAGLPQMKLGWILVRGPLPQRKESLDRLEIIADTYLSVGTPVQHATRSLLALCSQVRSQIRDRIRSNYNFLSRAVVPTAVQCLETEGGWYAILRVPSTQSEEEWALQILNDRGVLVHPGYFYDFAEEAFLVLSLLPRRDLFEEGVSRLLAELDAG
jgi:aspartate/methionine/tyrosine aminotransferase